MKPNPTTPMDQLAPTVTQPWINSFRENSVSPATSPTAVTVSTIHTVRNAMKPTTSTSRSAAAGTVTVPSVQDTVINVNRVAFIAITSPVLIVMKPRTSTLSMVPAPTVITQPISL